LLKDVNVIVCDPEPETLVNVPELIGSLIPTHVKIVVLLYGGSTILEELEELGLDFESREDEELESNEELEFELELESREDEELESNEDEDELELESTLLELLEVSIVKS
jgi:hypothetical protein